MRQSPPRRRPRHRPPRRRRVPAAASPPVPRRWTAARAAASPGRGPAAPAARRRSPAPASRPDPGSSAGRRGARRPRRAGPGRARRTTRAASRSRSTSTCRASRPRSGSASTGRCRSAASSRSSRSTQPASARRARSRSPATRAVSSRRSGTSRRPASVGVEQRRSATWSTSGVSGSCPIAETTGVRHAATARQSVSSENGSRSSTLPPPRASTMTSTSGSRSSTPIASTICGTASAPCVAVCSSRKRTAGQRAVALETTSCSAAEARPVIKPDAAGQERETALAGGVEEPLRGQQRAQALDAGQQLADPDRADRVDAQAQRAPPEEERRLAVHHHPVALGDGRTAVADQPDRGGELQRHVGGGVAQDEERGARARPRGDLRELALHPHGARAGPPTRRSCARRCGRATARRRSSAPARSLAALGRQRPDGAVLNCSLAHPSLTAAIRLLSMVTYGGRSPCACSQASSARRSSTPRWRSLPRSWGMVSEP